MDRIPVLVVIEGPLSTAFSDGDGNTIGRSKLYNINSRYHDNMLVFYTMIRCLFRMTTRGMAF